MSERLLFICKCIIKSTTREIRIVSSCLCARRKKNRNKIFLDLFGLLTLTVWQRLSTGYLVTARKISAPPLAMISSRCLCNGEFDSKWTCCAISWKRMKLFCHIKFCADINRNGQLQLLFVLRTLELINSNAFIASSQSLDKETKTEKK